MRRSLFVVSIAFLIAVASPARAQFCPGVSPWVFDDVLASDPFCGFITWMADNGITLGCVTIDANHRLYCPSDNVTRKQMAAFMNRLGNVRVEAVDTGPGLTGGPITSVGTINLATTQLLPTTACASNQIPKWNGSAWACAADATGAGTVTSVGSGTGLAGGPITASGTLSIAASYQLPQSCTNGQVPKSSGAGGWTCANDVNSGGTVTIVGSGTGLSGGPITGSGTLSIATGYQLPQGCASGQTAQSTGSAWVCASAGSVSGNIDLPNSTSASVGNITKPGASFLHNYGLLNMFAGFGAGNFTLTGFRNAGIGYQALAAAANGSWNTATGASALASNTDGHRNTGNGESALGSNVTGYDNTAIGATALFANVAGQGNTAIGAFALYNNTGSNNLALGAYAGLNLAAGSDNIYLANNGFSAESATIRIGTGSQTRAFVAGIRGVTTVNNNAVNVVIDSAGQLGTVSSSRKVKDDIADMGEASAVLMKLHPVTFRYKAHQGSGPVQYGLIAEEVAEVAPGLAARGGNGEIETVYYQHLAPMLLNEYQKLRKAFEDERIRHAAEIAELRRAVEVLQARTSPEGRVAAK